MNGLRNYEEQPLDGQPNWLRIQFGRPGSVEGLLSIFTFSEGEHFIAVAPALKLTGYGSTVEEAKYMLRYVVLEDYFERITATSEAEAFAELSKLGWSMQGSARDFTSGYVDRDGVLRNFHLPADTEIEEQALALAA